MTDTPTLAAAEAQMRLAKLAVAKAEEPGLLAGINLLKSDKVEDFTAELIAIGEMLPAGQEKNSILNIVTVINLTKSGFAAKLQQNRLLGVEV